MEPQLGRVFANRYRADKVLGGGGAGLVYRAHDLEAKRDVALKVMHPRLAGDPLMGKRFLREVDVGRRIHHANVVAILDTGTLEDGALFLVMEMVIGETLAKTLARAGHFDPRRAHAVVRQVLLGLEEAHRAGVVHRDIKPENVLLVRDPGSGEERVKIADFGIAADADAREKLTAVGVTFGSPEYISPEMSLGRPVDGRADLYSVGVMMFEMLTGCLPFHEANADGYLRAHASRQPPTMHAVAPELKLPAVLEALIQRTLAKRREDRFASARAMIEALEAALGPPVEHRAAASGRRLLAVGLGVAVVLVAAGVVALVLAR